MKKLTIFVGSVLGGTEFVADRLAEQAEQAGYEVDVISDFSQFTPALYQNSLWVICTSTHGAGDIPDNIQPFADWLTQKPDLSAQPFGLLGIGDSSYDTFCNAAKTLQSHLLTCQASPKGEIKLIDVQTDPFPEDPALEWFKHWLPNI